MSLDHGDTWHPAPTSSSQTTAGVLDLMRVPSTGTLLAGLWGGRVYRSTDDGATWDSTTMDEYTNIGSENTLLETAGGDSLYAAGWIHGDVNGGIIWLSLDDGQHWAVADSGLTVGPLRVIRIYDMEETSWGALMCGFQPGPDSVVIVSWDRGASWQSLGVLRGAREVMKLLPIGQSAVLAATAPNGDVFRYEIGVTAVPPPAEEPARFGVAAVLGGFPSPFSTATAVRFQVPATGAVELIVVDVQGRRVRTLTREIFGPGVHEVVWDGTSDAGRPVASGVYFLRSKAGGRVTYQRVVRTR